MDDDPYFLQAEQNFIEKHISPKVVRSFRHQTGKKPNIPIDKSIKALRAGKRISKSGKIYWESRKNRSDLIPKNKL